MKVYLDMDGVLVDLWNGYKAVVGMSLTEANARHGSTSDEIWIPTFEVDEFWYNLPKDSGADIILTYMEENHPLDKTFILSAPIRADDTCEAQKRKWVEKHTHILNHHVHIVPRKDKVDFAWCTDHDKPNILIDDYDKNITEWEAHGGIGIHHTDVESTLITLNDILRGT